MKTLSCFVIKFTSLIVAVLSCFDRVIFKGYLPITNGPALEGFVDYVLKIRRCEFTAFAEEQSKTLVAYAKRLAEEAGAEYRFLQGHHRKDKLVDEILRKRTIADGLICVLCCMETCPSFKLVHGKGRPQLVNARRPQRVLYLYFLDPDLGQIYDDDTTKFCVINDASSSDRTYEYGALGTLVGHYTINSSNTAPRGAASTAADATVWVVDANQKVYVHNTSGGLLGSWSAGSQSSHARVEGIATNGTDVWIVDASQRKVNRYANAAGLRSGSQNASSSFYLSASNANSKDLVTDGTSLWTVDDGGAVDQVFKYTLPGSQLGSWTIVGAGSSPTGITLDPTNVSTLWIVDSGTKRVYQFDNAAGLTSGSQSPSTSFALAAGNTNPQGIADPPAGASLPAVAASCNLAISPGLAVRDQSLIAWPDSTGPREFHGTQPRTSRHVAKHSQILPDARQSVRWFRNQAALPIRTSKARSDSARFGRQASSSPSRRTASEAAKTSTPCGDQPIP